MSRSELLSAVEEAMESGVSKKDASEVIGLNPKTLSRWMKDPNGIDRRSNNKFHTSNKLTREEEAEILDLISSPAYRDKAPYEVVALLAEEGRYICSERTIYRLLERLGLNTHRSKTKAPEREKPSECVATNPNQVYTWDISYLHTKIPGVFYYLYVFIDIWDRTVVGWSIHEKESGVYAAQLLRKTCFRNGVSPKSLIIHQDNGAPMISTDFLLELEKWGKASYSRPGVSDDNPFSESFFKTVKYNKTYPRKFNDTQDAISWFEGFLDYYHNEHLHSGIGLVTPMDRRTGKYLEKLQRRRETYKAAKETNPNRWSKDVRKWESPSSVYLNSNKKFRNREKIVA